MTIGVGCPGGARLETKANSDKARLAPGGGLGHLQPGVAASITSLSTLSKASFNSSSRWSQACGTVIAVTISGSLS